MTHPHLHLPARFRSTQCTRRVFLADLGRGALAAFAVPIFAACSSDDDPTATPTPEATRDASMTPSASATEAGASGTATASATPSEAAAADTGTWARANLGFVSAYVLLRAGEAAIVDTGTSGSAGDIEATLAALGSRCEDVGHVIATHSHGDHVGSLAAVLEAAPDATGYCGAGDLAAISAPRDLVAVGNGDAIFGLQVIETPGHTPGHISLLDAATSTLLTGDALNGSDGGVIGPNAQFTPDMATAIASVGILAGYEYETIYFGHGEPVLTGGAAAVAALAAQLG